MYALKFAPPELKHLADYDNDHFCDNMKKWNELGTMHRFTVDDCLKCKWQDWLGELNDCNHIENNILTFTQPNDKCYKCELIFGNLELLKDNYRCKYQTWTDHIREILLFALRFVMFYIGFVMLTNKKLKNHPYGIWGAFFLMWSGFYEKNKCMTNY